MRLSLRSWTVVPAVLLLVVPACNKKEGPPGPDVKPGQTVRGKVTYQGKALPYGFVLLYNLETSLDKKTATMTPAGIGNISKDGSYELKNVPSGPALFCVACDPDIPPMNLLQPTAMGGGLRTAGDKLSPGGGGGPEPTSGPPGAPQGLPGPPGGGSPGMPPGPPMMGGSGGPPGGAGMPIRPIPVAPGLELNPMTKELSKDQKAMLKEVHKKYSAFGRSPLMYTLEVGEQSFDLNLH